MINAFGSYDVFILIPYRVGLSKCVVTPAQGLYTGTTSAAPSELAVNESRKLDMSRRLEASTAPTGHRGSLSGNRLYNHMY